VRFFVAWRDGVAVGCGGVALFADFAELKRMYVRPAARGSGAADALIAQLEGEAAAAGLRVVRLETGPVQRAAIAFYRRHGYRECAAFEPYASMPPENTAGSYYMEKRLPSASARSSRSGSAP
jgi:putative acetyltransferase